MTLQSYLKEVRERAEKATPGPWSIGYWSGRCHLPHIHGEGDCKYDYELRADDDISHHSISCVHEHIEVIETTDEYGSMSKPNAQFIAHSRIDIEILLAICERQATALEFYARSSHIEDLEDDLENPSGEPQNWVCDSDGKFNLENGGFARQAQADVAEILRGRDK